MNVYMRSPNPYQGVLDDLALLLGLGHGLDPFEVQLAGGIQVGVDPGDPVLLVVVGLLLFWGNGLFFFGGFFLFRFLTVG